MMFRGRCLFQLSVVLSLCAFIHAAQAQSPRQQQRQQQQTRINESLRRELLAMEKADQDARNKNLQLPQAERERVLHTTIKELDLKHTKRLQQIIRQFGWPSAALVGTDGTAAAFLIVQHSPSHAFQKRCLPLVRAAAKRGELRLQDVALLTDRVLTGEGQPQIYGTQFKFENGKLVPYPIIDASKVDARRAEMKLPPLAVYIKMLEEMYNSPAQDKAP